MKKGREAYVCPHCKLITLKNPGEKPMCRCGYIPKRFKNYNEFHLELMRKEEIENKVNEYLFPEFNEKDSELITYTDAYLLAYRDPYISNEKFEKNKRKDYSYWLTVHTFIPFALIITIIGTLVAGLPVFIIGMSWIIFIDSKKGINYKLKQERERREMVNSIKEKNQYEFKCIRASDRLDKDIPLQPIEEKYIKIKGWKLSLIGENRGYDKQNIYLSILDSIIRRMNGDPNNFIVEVSYEDACNKKQSGLYYYQDKKIKESMKFIFDDNISKTDIFNYIMNNDVTYFFDMNKEVSK